MNFGSAFTKLCSLTFILICPLVHATLEVEQQIISTESKNAYKIFLQKVDECSDKKTRNINPYPISSWLISLPRKKQISTLSYLHHLAQYNCSAKEQAILVDSLQRNNEKKVISIMTEKGWLDAPVLKYEAEFTESDKRSLQILIDKNYLPFNGVELDSIIRKLRPEIDEK